MQKAQYQKVPYGTSPYQFVSQRFQVLFHSPHRGTFNLSLAVLVHYRSVWVFSLGPWPGRIPTGFHVSRGTQEPHLASFKFHIRGFHSLWPAIPSCSTTIYYTVMWVLQHPNKLRFRLLRFRSPLLTEYNHSTTLRLPWT